MADLNHDDDLADLWAEYRRQRDSRPLWARGWSKMCRWGAEASYRAGRAWNAICGREGEP